MTALVKIWKDHLVALHEDESGATMIEYGVLIGLITVLIVALVGAVGVQLENAWTVLNDTLTAAGL